MSTLISLVLFLLGIPVVMFTLECLLGFFASRRIVTPSIPEDKRTAILMPAHNEEEVIAKTLESIKAQLGPHDDVIVVADNCSDNTANIVREYGFTALERHNDNERGKGYALDFGMQHLKAQENHPDIVIIIDADCLLGENALTHLKHQVLMEQRPAQAQYLMKRGEIDRIAVKVSEFAFLVKNKIRLRGLDRMGMPVPLTGTGMAFPWEALANAQLATGDIVEDMRLGVELAEHGMGAGYCDYALVYSYFPTSEEAEKTQRERWEHGHLSTLKQFAPRLLKRAVTAPSLEALGMMLDLIIPPLSLLVMIIGATWVTMVFWGLLFGEWQFAGQAFDYLLILGISIVLTWWRYGRDILSTKQMLHIPVYIISKIAIYVGYIVRKQTKWIRTDRN